MSMKDIHLILVDPNHKLCEAWHKQFDELPNVEIINEYFENLPQFDCMVSAANSFGLMDGGVDLAIIWYFGNALMVQVQKQIIEEYRGEQPVGTSMIVETNHPDHPYIAHTPTMRVPMEIARTDNVYLAMWALLIELSKHNQSSQSPIHTIACPGLGTATGRVPANEAARQMALAYRNFLKPPTYIDWRFASDRQDKIRYGGDMGLHFPAID